MTALHSRAVEGLTLADAIARAALLSGIALLATPARHQVADIRDGACHGPGGPCPLDEVFEARVIGTDLELRWLHSSSGLGRAVALAEQEAALPQSFGDRLPVLEAVRTFDQRYLLWGTTTDPIASGWATLFSSRIGTLSVPVTVAGSGRKIWLRAREYIAVESAYGNAYVAEERLLGLEEAAR